jgi:hypothetical protein
MAYKVIIRCPDAEDVIRLLKEKHGADYSRIWRIYEHTIGVFTFEWAGVLAGYVNLITLDHDKSSKVKVKADGSVICQNCGKQFMITQND